MYGGRALRHCEFKASAGTRASLGRQSRNCGGAALTGASSEIAGSDGIQKPCHRGRGGLPMSRGGAFGHGLEGIGGRSVGSGRGHGLEGIGGMGTGYGGSGIWHTFTLASGGPGGGGGVGPSILRNNYGRRKPMHAACWSVPPHLKKNTKGLPESRIPKSWWVNGNCWSHSARSSHDYPGRCEWWPSSSRASGKNTDARNHTAN
jgi:hypothetical protein